MREKICKIDLHIHTPASNCYKGTKNDDAYFDILRKAKKKDLKIIAFTDHNSIGGYKRFNQICQQWSRQRDKKRRLRILRDLLLLPGVEFEVSNGIHFLVIFDNHTSVADIEAFLRDGGYAEDDFGAEIPNRISNWDVLDFLREVKRFNCIVICSHIDSSKGVYNVIPQGTLRAKCFASEQIHGIEYENEVTKDKIANLIKTSKDYQRKTSIAFVKFSDAHNISNVGDNYTFVKLDELSFDSLKSSFGNSSERISVEFPETQAILDKLINREISFGIEDFSYENKLRFKKLICALNNSTGGYCLFGITENKNKVGLDFKFGNKKELKNKMKGYLDHIFTCVKEIDGEVNLKPGVYPIRGKRIIISVQVQKSDVLINIKNDGNIYTIRDGKIDVIFAKELQHIIESKSLSLLETKIQKKLGQVEGEVESIRNCLKAIPIMKKFEENSIRLIRVINDVTALKDVRLPKSQFNRFNRLKTRFSNGQHQGDTIFFEHKIEPRLDYAYLRFSPPILNLKLHNKMDNKESVYLVPGGAVFYSRNRLLLFTNNTGFAIAFSSQDVQKYSNKFLVAFLKSSFWLWYCLNRFESYNVISKDIFNKIVIPRINFKNPQQLKIIKDIDFNVDKILRLETSFLKNIGALKDRTNTEKLLQKVEQHNKSIDKFAYEIDKYIYLLVGLVPAEIKTIESSLRSIRVYQPELTKG